jgi:anti-sigma regulatory factor (Ser/Thr protein kinase)/CheY-like chemotaxis protein
MASILMIDPAPGMRDALTAAPALAGHSIEAADGNIDALHRLRVRPVEVLVTSPGTTVGEDLALLSELRRLRPGIRALVLAARARDENVVAALRARVFALFTEPFDLAEIAAMAARAAEAAPAHDGIELISARPDWLSARLDGSLVTAERLLRFIAELRTEVPTADREGLLAAYREVLENAIEHGVGGDRKQSIEVAAVRSARALVFYVRDEGAGFDRAQLPDLRSLPREGAPAHGFGLLLAQRVVDEVMCSDRGNEVVLVKHLR